MLLYPQKRHRQREEERKREEERERGRKEGISLSLSLYVLDSSLTHIETTSQDQGRLDYRQTRTSLVSLLHYHLLKEREMKVQSK